MRKWKRAIAHKNMERQGLKHVNRHTNVDGKRRDSYFALNWRDWVKV